MLLSLVVVAHRHQAWIRPFLTSVLEQAPSSDVEVLVVDDASPDHTPSIVAEVAADDPRVRLHRQGSRAGTSSSWRTGLELTTGEYVWVLEPVDLLLQGGLREVLAQLAERRPDVVLVPGVELDLFGGRRAADAAGATPLLRDRVVRRGHLETIPPPHGGALGRVPWATGVLTRATSVVRLTEPAWAHRRLPAEVRRQWLDDQAWDVFEAYEEAFDELAAHDGSVDRAAALATAMVADQRAALDTLPDEERPRFIRRMASSIAAHGTGGEQRAGVVGRLERHALSTGDLRELGLAVRIRRVRNSIRPGIRRMPRSPAAARARLKERRYAAMRRGPLDPRLVVYSAYWGTAFSCNPRAVYLAMRELRPDLQAVWVVKAGSEGVVPDGVDVVVEGTGPYYRVMARATYFVNNVNFANDIVKRPGQIHLQTHHGTPLKTMGLDLVHAAHSSLGLNFRRLMKRVQRWDYSISANEFTTEIWERVYPSGTYESLETGYPRNDELARATDADRARIRADLGIDDEARVLLYTPTHREDTKQYVPLLDPVALAESLGPTWTILMRSHYFYREAATGSHPRVLDVANHPSIEELSIASDVLVTDYSSLMFDFAVLDRPIVIYAPDWDEYRTQRGTYFDLMAEPPGAVAFTQDELARLLTDGRHDDEASTAARASFRARFVALEDGDAARRVVERVWPATH
jgi:CDP-glycerol glycerophosphotransferase